MKSCEEMAQSLFERRNIYMAQKKRANRRVAGVATCAAVLSVLMIVGFAGRQIHKQPAGNFPTPQAHGETLKNPAPTTPPVTPAVQDRIVINQVPSIIIDTYYIALHLEDFVPLSAQELAAYFGTSVEPRVPEDMKQKKIEPTGIYRRNKGQGQVYHDVQSLDYENVDQTRLIRIQYSKGQLPFVSSMMDTRTCEDSVLCGQQVCFGRNGSECYAEFFYREVGFRIWTLGLNDQELVELVRSVMD